VHKDADAWRSNGSAIEIEVAMDLGPRRQFWIDSRPTEEVEGQLGLREETIPKMEGKVFIHAAEPGDKMIFEGTNSTFGSITAVDTRGCKLVVDALGPQKLFEGNRTFVVEALELWAKTGSAKAGMEDLIAGEDGGTGARLDGFGQDTVTVVII
jgi:hypothetical protein